MYFNSVADLVAQTSNPLSNQEFVVGGYFKPGDGGGGIFVWVPVQQINLRLPNDTGVIFWSPLYPLGYYQRIFSGPVNVRWFGAIFDPILRPDVTSFVHAARNSKVFADNGTIYFPKGQYPGSFEFFFNSSGHPQEWKKDEINIIGDGQGTVLCSNLQIRPGTNKGFPILKLGSRRQDWRWAKVSNLRIDGNHPVKGKFSDGIEYADQGNNTTRPRNASGRWQIDQVYFSRCDKAVHKPHGNLGNHYIDCTWYDNNYGVYATPETNPQAAQHIGCDRYSGGHFQKHSAAAIYYTDIWGGGQVIIDGAVIEGNLGWGIYMKLTQNGRMMTNALCIRNVYFNGNNYDNPNYGGVKGDMYFEGVRSVRIDDCTFWSMQLVASSVNLFNCCHETGGPGNRIKVDAKSSLVAYEQRYFLYPSEKIFINSISYDATPEIGHNGNSPAPWIGSSVWGPLRAVTTTRSSSGIIVSEQFDSFTDEWHDYGTFNTYNYGSLSLTRKVLGKGSNEVKMGPYKHIVSSNVIGHYAKRGKYTVWSIHTYMEEAPPISEFYGEIISADGGTRLGLVYFRNNQWTCSYGMRYLADDVTIRLAFRTLNASVTFYITDYQVIQFDDLASANSFVHSREFTSRRDSRKDAKLIDRPGATHALNVTDRPGASQGLKVSDRRQV